MFYFQLYFYLRQYVIGFTNFVPLEDDRMSKICRFVSDNTPTSEPNVLTMVQRDDEDIEFCVSVYHPQEQGISVRASRMDRT